MNITFDCVSLDTLQKKKIKALCWLTIYNLLRGIMALDKCCQANGQRSPIITPPTPRDPCMEYCSKTKLTFEIELESVKMF